jgi:small subunit ribosomal protein S16
MPGSRRATAIHRPGCDVDDFAKYRAKTMVKIRLSRGGAKGRPFYHIIVTDERNARDGRNIERVGYFNPIAAGKDVRLELDTAKVKSWVEKGAQMTEKVKSLYKEASKKAA